MKPQSHGYTRPVGSGRDSVITPTDSTHLNFASQLGLRFQVPQFPASLELSTRHWSNGGVRTPNRGQDFTILTVRFAL